MRFMMEVDLSEMPDGKEGDELARILRYWAGGVKQLTLAPGEEQTIYDSDYTAVGAWRLEE